jgi:peptidoglycan/xylan/chitin deacetylase (PgdA/CDA1 family)
MTARRPRRLTRAALTVVIAALLAATGCAVTPATVPPLPPGTAAAPADGESHRSYPGFTAVVPREGDTLESLAERFLGDPGMDWAIARYSGSREVRPGQPLIVPRAPFDRGGLREDRYQTVPVLSYHKFCEAPSESDAMTVTRAAFESQMKLLSDRGYRVITLDELYDFLDFKRELPEKSIVITFDDGWRSMYEIAFPILRRYGYRATLFVSTEMITGSRKTLSWELIREMMAGGIAVESHTVAHRNLEELKDGESLEEYVADMERELAQSAKTIREKTGCTVKYLAYPYGATNSMTILLAARLGYRGALTVKRGPNPFFVHNFRVNRSMIFGGYDLSRFEKNLATSSRKALQ